jgi:hypothetical protein
VRGLVGRLARLRPTLIERTRRAADAGGRAFAREAALIVRRRGERAFVLARDRPAADKSPHTKNNFRPRKHDPGKA